MLLYLAGPLHKSERASYTSDTKTELGHLLAQADVHRERVERLARRARALVVERNEGAIVAAPARREARAGGLSAS